MPNEVLTSWIKRLAQEHLHDLGGIMDGIYKAASKDIIDNNPDNELLEYLSNCTGTEVKDIEKMTFRYYNDHYPKAKYQGNKWYYGLTSANNFPDRFVLSLRSRTIENGPRYCPKCLEDDEIPYFRLYWRLGYYTSCHIHEILMINECQRCSNGVYYFNTTTDIEKCRNCKFDLYIGGKIHVDTSVTIKLHRLFFNKIAYFGLKPEILLGHIWRTYSLLYNRKDGYFEKICKKFGLWNDQIENPLYIRHQGIKLVWYLFENGLISFEKPFLCIECKEIFPSNSGLSRHLDYHKEPEMECEICNELFHKKFELERHQKVHKNPVITCIFCKAPFNRKQRMTSHVHKIHSKKLQSKIRRTIKSLDQSNKKVNYLTVAKHINISRSLFSLYSVYSDLFREHNDLRYKFHQYSVLPEKERLEKYKELVKLAINRMLKFDNDIAQTTVAKEMGVNRKLFYDYPDLADIIEKYRTIGRLDPNNLLEEVEKGIEILKTEDRDVSFASICDITGRDYQTLNQHEKIRELILSHKSGYLPNEVIKMQDVKTIIEKLNENGKKLTKTFIMEKLGISWNKLHDQSNIVKYVKDQLACQKERENNEFKERINNTVIMLINANCDISYRKVAKELNVDVHKLLNDKKFKQIVENALKIQEQNKINLVHSTINDLIDEDKRITFIEIHRRTGLSRNFIENTDIRKTVLEKMKEQKSI